LNAGSDQKISKLSENRNWFFKYLDLKRNFPMRLSPGCQIALATPRFGERAARFGAHRQVV
jgi:hypothetical protein